MLDGEHPMAWHKNKKGFIKEFGNPQHLFMTVVCSLIDSGEEVFNYITDEQVAAIKVCP